MTNIMHDSDHDIDEELKSKSELKREMQALQDFAYKIVRMSKHQRSKLPLNEELQAAMVLAGKIMNKPEALSRHVRFVCKLLLDTDLDAIRQAIDVMENKHQQDTLNNQKLEVKRDELLSASNDEIESLLNDCPSMERQKLRQLIRQAAKEKKAEKPSKGYKELYKYLKTHTD